MTAEVQNDDGITFAAWQREVDLEVSSRIGVSASDLADYPSWSLWDACIDPVDAAGECIEGDDVFGGHGFGTRAVSTNLPRIGGYGTP